MLLVAGCGATAPGGGMSLAAAEATAGAAASAASAALAAAQASTPPPLATPARTAVAAAGMATSTSLRGWTVGVGTGGPGPALDAGIGDPTGPSMRLPGDRAWLWQDLRRPVSAFSYEINTQGLADFFFGADDTGRGYMFRIDTRGGASYSGFARTTAWTAWDCPGGGTSDAPAGTWIHVSLVISGTAVAATVTWRGGRETFQMDGQADACAADGQAAALSAYHPSGTAFGFQGDALGAASVTWISDFR